MASSYTVKSGDVLLVPAATDKLASLTIEWQQNFGNKKANYHTGLVEVKGKPDARVLFFVASEWYTGDSGSGQHISKVATKVGDSFELKVDDKIRYGQKNAQGEARFIVYHDTSRNPYQYRFVTPALRIQALGLGQLIAKWYGLPEEVSNFAVKEMTCGVIGDPLRKF